MVRWCTLLILLITVKESLGSILCGPGMILVGQVRPNWSIKRTCDVEEAVNPSTNPPSASIWRLYTAIRIGLGALLVDRNRWGKRSPEFELLIFFVAFSFNLNFTCFGCWLNFVNAEWFAVTDRNSFADFWSFCCWRLVWTGDCGWISWSCGFVYVQYWYQDGMLILCGGFGDLSL